MKKRTKSKSRGGRFSLVISAILFVVVLVVLVIGVSGLADGADERGVETTRQALQQAVVLCYATEGFYPPSLSYIQEHYGVEVDETLYAVRYQVQGSNIMPVIQVARH